MSGKNLQAFFVFLSLLLPCYSLPLSTKGRWIVDAQTGERVKLHCANWPTHSEPMLAEGLHARPLSQLVSDFANAGFNCVRLTWATFMFTRPSYGEALVGDTFESLNLVEARLGLERHNPWVLNLTHIEAYLHVVNELGNKGIMVDADNHISKPTWCCGEDDGNGFFGDTYFDYKEWLRGVTAAASLLKGRSNVVAIGMRNEPRGSRQNKKDWYKYFYEGAVRVHEVNPDVLVIISGLSYATTLSHLKERPFGTKLSNKIVFEAHSYGWDKVWGRPINKVCNDKMQVFINNNVFVTTAEEAFPLFVGEFGLDHRGLNLEEDHFLSCFLSMLAEHDLDWGLWGFQGSYYIRQGNINTEETFGVMDYHWNRIRNPTLLERLSIIQRMNIDPSSQNDKGKIMFLPQSGKCLFVTEENEVIATSCKNSTILDYVKEGGHLWIKGTSKCINVGGDGLQLVVSTSCGDDNKQSTWITLSESKNHLAAMDENGEYMCLHKESPFTNRIVSKKCQLLEDDTECHIYPQTDPTAQWFKLVDTNVFH